MAEPIYLVQGDSEPQFQFTFTRSDTEQAIDLDGATVKFYMRERFGTTLTLTKTATITDADNGVCVFNFSQGDLDIDAGEYEGEVEITYSTGKKETVYEKFNVVLREDLQ